MHWFGGFALLQLDRFGCARRSLGPFGNLAERCDLGDLGGLFFLCTGLGRLCGLVGRALLRAWLFGICCLGSPENVVDAGAFAGRVRTRNRGLSLRNACHLVVTGGGREEACVRLLLLVRRRGDYDGKATMLLLHPLHLGSIAFVEDIFAVVVPPLQPG